MEDSPAKSTFRRHWALLSVMVLVGLAVFLSLQTRNQITEETLAGLERWETRSEAAREVREMGTNVVPEILRRLEEKPLSARWQVLGRLPGARSEGSIQTNKVNLVRALEALGPDFDPHVDQLIPLLQEEEDPQVRQVLMGVLVNRGQSPAALECMMSSLLDADDFVRSAAYQGLMFRKVSRKEMLTVLVRDYWKATDEEKLRTLRFISTVDLFVPGTCVLLERSAIEDSYEVALRATEILTGRGPCRLLHLVPAMMVRIEEAENTEQRIEALSLLSLAKSHAAPAISVMLRYQGDTNAILRASIAGTLGQICRQPEVSIPALTNLLADPEWVVRAKAVESLGRFQGAARDVIPQIEAMPDHPQTDLFRKDALRLIQR